MAREQVTTVPRRQARGGGHVACAPAAGRLRAATRALRSRARVRPHKMSGRCLACFRVRHMWVSARSDAACVCMCACRRVRNGDEHAGTIACVSSPQPRLVLYLSRFLRDPLQYKSERRARLFVTPNTPRAPNNPTLSEAG